jgi:hypothetical protein
MSKPDLTKWNAELRKLNAMLNMTIGSIYEDLDNPGEYGCGSFAVGAPMSFSEADLTRQKTVKQRRALLLCKLWASATAMQEWVERKLKAIEALEKGATK